MIETPDRRRERRGARGKEEESRERQDREGGEDEEEDDEDEDEKLLRRLARAYCRNQLKAKREKKRPVKISLPPGCCLTSPYLLIFPSSVSTIIKSNPSSSCPGSLMCPSIVFIMLTLVTTIIPSSSTFSTSTAAKSIVKSHSTVTSRYVP